MKTYLLCFTLLVCIGMGANAQSTQLWGTATGGGATGQGTIFSANPDGSNLHTVYNFVNATGAMPLGGVERGKNGKLYGVTELGGYGDSCVVYSYDPGTGIYTDIHDLYQYMSLGYGASSKMTAANDGKLYGLCPNGGAHGGGVIYRVDPFTDTYTDIYDFTSATDGAWAYGSLKQLSDGKLYGMTSSGGSNNAGVLFSFDPAATNSFTKLYVFNNASGGHPYYSSVMEASNGKIYGMTQSGGSHGMGVLFSFDLGLGIYTDLYDFDGTHGSSPQGSLIQASDGNLYGMTPTGGTYSRGVLFSFNINTGVYSELFSFNNTNGASPKRSLVQGSSGKLYGTTYQGGINSAGVAFSYDITNSTYTKLVDFNSTTTGSAPDCEIVEVPTMLETGMATINGSGAMSIFPNPATNFITILNSKQEETLQFFDLLGKQLAVIKTPSFGKTTLDISDFPSVFFVKTQGGEMEKIVRQ